MEQDLSWRGRGNHPQGIIVAANESQAWLLEWWWKNYSTLNQYPVTFVDLGLSEKSKRWCDDRGECIEFPSYPLKLVEKNQIDPNLLKEWDFFYGKIDWDKRSLYFQKPLICLLSPYQRTLWLDLDCEVRSDLREIFAYLGDPGITISEDLTLSSTLKKTLYNSGVVGFSHGHPLILEWAYRAFDQNGHFLSDQELLSHLISLRNEPIELLPSLYQWSHYYGDNSLARVVHWHGAKGKAIIRSQIEEGSF
jgi:hypothetical protein